MFVICVEAIIYLLKHNLHDCTFEIIGKTLFEGARFHEKIFDHTFFYKSKIWKNNKAEIAKKKNKKNKEQFRTFWGWKVQKQIIKMTMIYIYFKNKVIFFDVIECSVGLYNFILLKSSIEIFFIFNIPCHRELLTSGVISTFNR